MTMTMTVTDKMKHDENTKNYEQIDVAKKDVVIYNRVNCILTTDKWPIETKDIDDDFMREYDEMYKSMNISRLLIIMKPGDTYKVPWRVISP